STGAMSPHSWLASSRSIVLSDFSDMRGSLSTYQSKPTLLIQETDSGLTSIFFTMLRRKGRLYQRTTIMTSSSPLKTQVTFQTFQGRSFNGDTSQMPSRGESTDGRCECIIRGKSGVLISFLQ